METTSQSSEPAQTWARGPQDPVIQTGEVHIWKYDISHDGKDGGSLANLTDSLCAEERQRLSRIGTPEGKYSFIMSHGKMRLILARYLMMEPAEIAIERQANGKPRLVTDNPSCLEFNLSHSHGKALVAVSSKYPVGVDIEKVRDKIAYAKLAQRFFSAREARQLLALPKTHQLPAFITLWTRKEAIIKATGSGIAKGLREFELSIPNRDIQESVTSSQHPGSCWTVYNLPAIDRYCAALACSADNLTLKCWDLD